MDVEKVLKTKTVTDSMGKTKELSLVKFRDLPVSMKQWIESKDIKRAPVNINDTSAPARAKRAK